MNMSRYIKKQEKFLLQLLYKINLLHSKKKFYKFHRKNNSFLSTFLPILHKSINTFHHYTEVNFRVVRMHDVQRATEQPLPLVLSTKGYLLLMLTGTCLRVMPSNAIWSRILFPVKITKHQTPNTSESCGYATSFGLRLQPTPTVSAAQFNFC